MPNFLSTAQPRPSHSAPACLARLHDELGHIRPKLPSCMARSRLLLGASARPRTCAMALVRPRPSTWCSRDSSWKGRAPVPLWWRVTCPLGVGTSVRCSSESPLSLANGVWNVLKEVSQGSTKIPSRTRVVLLRKRKGKSVFDWGWLQLRLVESSSQTPPKRNLRNIRYQLAVWQTNPQFRVQLTFGAGVAWSSCLSS
ncbi:hypothetical protein PIB30_064485 [Stylosanthes scabra]|uniref:Uncharacterized protein n=1 Tax=Stylosanthes scabra TaxID=79078 RepID=A0ABU6RLT9_9FABA|nr:hypothetical protein [Stylosanthes scabra]